MTADAPHAPPASSGAVTGIVPNRLRAVAHVGRVIRYTVALAWTAARRRVLVATLLQTATGLLTGVQLLIIKRVASKFVGIAGPGGPGATSVIPELGALVVVSMVVGGSAALLGYQQRLLAERVGRYTMDRVIDAASGVGLAQLEDPEFHDQLERATTAGSFRPLEVVNALASFALATVVSVVVVVALFALEPLLPVLVLLAGVPVLIASLRNSQQMYAFEYAMTAHARERLHLMELMTAREAAKELRVFDASPLLRARYDTLSDEREDKMREFLAQRLRATLVATAGTAIGTAIALGALLALLASDRINLATATTAAVAMFLLGSRLSALTGALSKLVENSLFLDDLQKFLRLAGATERPDPPASATPPAAFEGLAVRGLSFVYPGTTRRVLEDIELDVEPGQVVALVGENGSGKTTLVKLLCGLYEADPRAVLWGGRPAEELDPAGLRSMTTVLFQDFVQYHLSVADNIALGRASAPADPEAIRRAAEQAGATGLIERLPAGMETRLGREFFGGHELSGGEWQRLALARAFFRGGDLLILDEPTAALDARAEYELFARMRELARGKTVVLISHRFANVRTADRIYVMADGRIAEAGTHEELMRRAGRYAELFSLQAAGYAPSPRKPG